MACECTNMCLCLSIPIQDYVSKDKNLKWNRLREGRGGLQREEVYKRKVQANKEKKKIECVAFI